ncbi:MAG: hypothetical protein H7203_01015 [Rhizobacter sp.]|nr:hypothetical protein [Burkholderiales bacterium]
MQLQRKIFSSILTLMVAVTATQAATFTTTNSNDSGGGSFRQAIISANAMAGPHTIAFNIPASTDANCATSTGVCSIALLSALPALTETVVIDGYSQPGATANSNPPNAGSNAALRVEITALATVGTSLMLGGSGSLVRGLIINRRVGIALVGTGGHTVAGNFIGSNADGSAGFADSQVGVTVVTNSHNNVIGGTTPAARNVISGNNTGIVISSTSTPILGTQIVGNLLGTNAAGTAAIANETAIAFVSVGGKNTIIGGTTAAARNVISGNRSGIVDESFLIGNASNNTISGNYIGVDITGAAALGNSQIGISTSSRGAVIGGSAPGAGNVIAASGTMANVMIQSRDVVVQGNWIGTGASGANAPTGFVPSAFRVPGIYVAGNTAVIGSQIGGTAAGAGNVIAFNTGHGVLLSDQIGNGHSILGNSIFSNGQLGINLYSPNYENSFGVTFNDTGDGDFGVNGQQNFPLLTTATTAGNVQGTLNSTASGSYRLEFFANAACDASGYGEGRTFIGAQSVATDGSGNASFNATFAALPVAQSVVTATATDSLGNTSEFSACVSAPLPVILTIIKSGSGSGTVTSLPAGINCGATCTASFAGGSAITLSATPSNAAATFSGWLGNGCTGVATCTTTLSAAATISATFALISNGPFNLDVEANSPVSQATAGNDGLLILRYLTGMSGATLISGSAVSVDATRNSAAALTAFLDDLKPKLDIDGNGEVNALTDGLLITRYLLGIRGAALISSAVGGGATRTTYPAIESYLSSLLPP